MNEWDSPDWDAGARTHNWRRHVPDIVRRYWADFTPQQKQALYQWACELAEDEVWE